jgi:DNA-binding MarR family transcriptional regulator
MMSRPLPSRQFAVLRYLADRKSATARDVTVDLRLNRTAAQNALAFMAAKGLVTGDPAAFPMTFAITDEGRAVLADAVTAAEGGES